MKWLLKVQELRVASVRSAIRGIRTESPEDLRQGLRRRCPAACVSARWEAMTAARYAFQVRFAEPLGSKLAMAGSARVGLFLRLIRWTPSDQSHERLKM